MSVMRNPPHPGRYIEEERTYLGISVQELANALGVPTIEITQLIEERISLTPDMANFQSAYFSRVKKITQFKNFF